MLKVVLIYAVFAAVWILLSDATLFQLVGDPAMLPQISIVKGLGFVTVTTLLLYVLLKRTWLRNAAELVEQNEKLRLQALVLDQIQDHVTVTDLSGVVTYVNQAQQRALQDDYTGLHVSSYSDGSVSEDTQYEIANSTLKDGGWHGTVINARKDGTHILVDLRTTLVRDKDGQPVAMVGVGTDITERKQAEAALQHRQDMLARTEGIAHVGSWEWDALLLGTPCTLFS